MFLSISNLVKKIYLQEFADTFMTSLSAFDYIFSTWWQWQFAVKFYHWKTSLVRSTPMTLKAVILYRTKRVFDKIWKIQYLEFIMSMKQYSPMRTLSSYRILFIIFTGPSLMWPGGHQIAASKWLLVPTENLMQIWIYHFVI